MSLPEISILRVVILGQNRFSGKCIVDQIYKHDGVKTSVSTIYKVLGDHGIKLWAERHGESTHAIRALGVLRHAVKAKDGSKNIKKQKKRVLVRAA
ncbi:MAG: hypothetical protein Q8P20_09895 [bacterium]|nr:hypothetical protein [bacterium]